VSVVMAVRDGATYLPMALASVQAQTLDDLEIVVVDDGSVDETPAILAEAARQDVRIRILPQPPSNLSSALNGACGEARGRYLARMDADDVALPERLALQVAFLESHPDVAVVGGAGILIDDRGLELGRADYPEDSLRVIQLLDSGQCPVIHPAVTMRAASFRAVSGYRPVMDVAQDYDLWLRIAGYGRITNIPQPVIRYRLHEAQRSTQSFEKTARATCAALAAASARARGEPDPLDSAESIDATLLRQLGVQPEDIATHEVNYALWLARTFARGGRHDLAEPLWSLCMARAGTTAATRLTRANVLRARGDAYRLRGLQLYSLRLRLVAAGLDPKGALRRFQRAH
jgi:Glycosyl transferase family 2